LKARTLALLVALSAAGCQSLLGVDFDDAHPRDQEVVADGGGELSASDAASKKDARDSSRAADAEPAPYACPSAMDPTAAASDYSSLDVTTADCQKIEPAADGGPGGCFDCGGRGGYALLPTVGSTTTLQIRLPSSELFDVPVVAPAASLGPKAEWRGAASTIIAGQLAPYAVIYRFLRYNASVNRQHHSLVVVKLTSPTPCVFSIIEASKQSGIANSLARDAADRACAEACPDSVPPLPPEVWN
jgi:hypothetical protein